VSHVSIRTLHFTNAWHPESGGIRTWYQALLNTAGKDDRHMAVVAPGDRTHVVELSATTRIYYVRAPRSPVFDRRYRLILPDQIVAPWARTLWRIVETERPDLIEVSDKYSLCYLAGIIKRRTGQRPTLVGFSQERMADAWRAFIGDRGADAFAEWYLGRIYMRQFDVHLANSEFTADELRRAVDRGGPERPLLWRLRPRIQVVPLGVDASGFDSSHRSAERRQRLLEQAGGSRSSTLVVYAGRLSPEKSVHWLVPAVAQARRRGVDVRLAIAGDGPSRAAIEQAARDVGAVTLLGHLRDRSELATLLASADVFLHPNPREPFGIGPLEAMASGVPVVVPRAGGVLSYASDVNAWLADPSPEGLGNVLVEVVTNRDDACARAACASETARAYDRSLMTRRIFRAYDEIHIARLANPTAYRLDTMTSQAAIGLG
jgi:alpha-1,6-mannosyltransferase